MIKLAQLQDSELAYQASQRLYPFIRYMWPVLHDGNEIISTRHVPLMCAYLEAVAYGKIKRLVICIPPGFAKSLTVSVFYPAWRWILDPSRQITSFSAANSVAVRDALRCRRLVESDRYQKIMRMAGVDFELRGDQNQKTNFELSRGGFRKAFTMGGKSFGERGDEQIIDDGHDAQDALVSPDLAIKRFSRDVDTFEGKLGDRLNDLNKSPRIVVQQRLHSGDIAGHCIDQGWTHLVLPMRYDPDHPQCSPDDWRTKKGELLCPELADEETVKRLESMPLADEKLQQRADLQTGDLFDSQMFMVANQTVEELRSTARRCVISVDPTGEGGAGSDPAAMTVFLEAAESSVAVEVSNFAITHDDTISEFNRLASKWRPDVAIIENKSLGPALISHVQDIGGIYIVAFKPSQHGGKYARARVSAMYWKDGRMKVAAKDGGLGDLIEQHCVFPNITKHDDVVDTCSQYAIWRFSGDGRSLPNSRRDKPREPRRIQTHHKIEIF